LLIGKTLSLWGLAKNKKIKSVWLVSEMGRISVAISDELEKSLRFKTIERFGEKRGTCPELSKKP
jgi:hypothetical protein